MIADRWLLLLLALLLALGCRPAPAPQRGCTSDADCPARSHCGPELQCVGDVPCASDRDCCVAERCDAGACRPRLRCTDASTCALPGAQCVAGVCARPRCESAADCAGGFACVLGVCAERAPCEGPCPQGQACAVRLDRCVDAAEASCPSGEIAVLDQEEATWHEGCAARRARCVAGLPLQPPQWGVPGLLLTGADALLDVGYDRVYGDVVVARRSSVAPHAVSTVRHVLGVPAGVAATGALDGPRQGIAAPGPDIGSVLAAVSLPAGRLLVAAGEAGVGVHLRLLGTSLLPDAAGTIPGALPGAMAMRIGADGRPRLLTFYAATATAPARLVLWTGPVSLLASDGDAALEGWSERLLLQGAAPGEVEAPFARLPAGRGAMLDLALDPSGVAHVAAYDADARNLAWLRVDGATVAIEEVPAEVVPGGSADVGRFPALRLDADGWPVIATLDHARGRLLLLRRRASGWSCAVVDDGGRPDGHHDVGAEPALLPSGTGWLIAAQDARVGRVVVHRTDADGNSLARVEAAADGTSGFAIAMLPIASKALVVATSGLRLGDDGTVRVHRALVDVVIGGAAP